MNTAHVMAWLTCLVLAFLACVLGAFNMGRTQLMERDLDKLKGRMRQAATLPAEDLARLRRSVNDVRAEVGELKAEGQDLPEEVRQRVLRLEALLEQMDRALARGAAQKTP